MQPKRTRSSKPKLFQCQGYGDCNMVFTRSEHLARHARKHTGEKPFICVVPECNKAFSRFDNMMQHTQTHRNNGNNNMMSHKRDTRSTTKAKCQQQQQKRYTIVSPISLSPSTNTICSSSSISSSSSEEDEEEEHHYPYHPHHKRRLSIADLCNPLITEEQSKLYQLTKDEFEALEGFGRFRHTPPSVFFKDLASTHVEN